MGAEIKDARGVIENLDLGDTREVVLASGIPAVIRAWAHGSGFYLYRNYTLQKYEDEERKNETPDAEHVKKTVGIQLKDAMMIVAT